MTAGTKAAYCPLHQARAKRDRGTPREHGYRSKGHAAFRAAVLARDRRCVICSEPSTVADHWPLSRKQLVRSGFDADDPERGRGLCASCHSRETARNQPGGSNPRAWS